MAVDFSLQLPCEVRKTLPEAKLLQMVKHRVLAQFAIAQFRQANPGFDPAAIPNEVEVHIRVKGPDGTAREAPVTVAQLLTLTAPLDGLKSHCPKCRANVADRPFGCIGKINYPITGVAENWLVSRLPDDPNNPALALLYKFLGDLEIDGAPVRQHRTRATMFQSTSSVTRRWGSPPNRKQITSDQILQILLFGGDIHPQQAQLYTQLLGLTTVLNEPHPQSPNIEQFKTFFCAVVMAGRLNCGVSVDS